MIDIDFTVPLVLICAIALVAWLRNQIRTFNKPSSPDRPDGHLPADEYRLLGDDWTERITEFRSEQFIRATRRRFAVMAVTGADPETNEDPSVTASGPLNEQGAFSNARIDSK